MLKKTTDRMANSVQCNCLDCDQTVSLGACLFVYHEDLRPSKKLWTLWSCRDVIAVTSNSVGLLPDNEMK